MPRAALEEARTAYGTDEDVIFVFPTSSEQWNTGARLNEQTLIAEYYNIHWAVIYVTSHADGGVF